MKARVFSENSETAWENHTVLIRLAQISDEPTHNVATGKLSERKLLLEISVFPIHKEMESIVAYTETSTILSGNGNAKSQLLHREIQMRKAKKLSKNSCFPHGPLLMMIPSGNGGCGSRSSQEKPGSLGS